jgi:type VI protein secretion system component VasF
MRAVRFFLCAAVLAVRAGDPGLGEAQTSPKAKPNPQQRIQELQAHVIDLQGQLLACQNAKVEQAKVRAEEETERPTREAVEAFRTFSSSIDAGLNWAAYRDALIPLKVKVDRLPANDATAQMKKTMEQLVDAGHLWNASITRSGTTIDEVRSTYFKYTWIDPIVGRYPGMKMLSAETNAVVSFGAARKEIAMELIRRSQEEIRQFYVVGVGGAAPTPTPIFR